MTKMMRASAIDGFGGPEVIQLQTLPVPEIGPDEVLIRVEVAGVAKWDASEREGKYAQMAGMKYTFPFVLGWEGAGTVAAVGHQVSRFEDGERVYVATVPNVEAGLYAEYAAVKAEHVAHVPHKLTIEQAGVMPWDALTAISGLEDALELTRGETLMVFGASGGVGHIAVQVAKRIGARVLAVASGDDGVALSKRHGADAVVDGRKDDVMAIARQLAPDGLDAALVVVGGEASERAMAAVRSGGRIAYPNGVMPTPKERPKVRLVAYDGRRDQVGTARLNRLIESGPLEIHVARTFGFEEVVEAHRFLGTHFLGKVALRLR